MKELLKMDYDQSQVFFEKKTWCCLNCFTLIDPCKFKQLTLQHIGNGVFSDLDTSGKRNGFMMTFDLCPECGTHQVTQKTTKHFVTLTNIEKIRAIRKLKLKRILK